MAFALPERPVEDYTLTVQALLVVRALGREAGEWFELWERINYPLTFYYGGAGDPTVADYMELADEVFGREFERDTAATESLLIVFVDRVSEMAPAHVQTHELRGMRFLPRDFPSRDRLLRASRGRRGQAPAYVAGSHVPSGVVRGTVAAR